VGIPEDDRLEMQHSVIRRKGLTMRVCRRMKHTYPRAIRLATSGLVDLHSMISHRVPLTETPTAFEMNTNYTDNVVKIIVDV
ncbi:MAG: alcohol dehydrogenase, partial [Chloroflexi bacterium]